VRVQSRRLEQIVAQKPTSLDEVGNKIDTLTSLEDGYLVDLRALTPPHSVAALFQHVLTLIRIEDHGMHNLDELASTGQWAQAAQLVRSRAWHEMLNRLGPPVKPTDVRCA
jgi:hypothetical protein